VFVDEVKAEEKGPGGTCSVALLVSGEVEMGYELVAVFDDPTWSSAAITRALNKRGYEIKADSIGRHRRRADGTGCKCPS